MKKQTIILGFSRYTNGKLAIKVRTILSRMAGNGYYPDPSPSLETVSQRADAYDAALKLMDGSDARRLAFRKERKALEQHLRFLGMYVIQHGNDDPVILESSGFDLTRAGERKSTQLLEIDGFKVYPDIVTGSMHMQCDAIDSAKVYIFQYTTAAEPGIADWHDVNGSRSAQVIEGLIPGVEYGFRMMVYAGRGRQVFSQVIRRFAS